MKQPKVLWIILQRDLDEDGDPNYWWSAGEPPCTSEREAKNEVRQYHMNPLIKRGEYRAFRYEAKQ